ncbi:MAG: RluA family pseudouridine synthase [Clostridiales bacterium]|jgi:23S rRNA pseudouridine1911/1915/1917 synthase|nr:RluA family pseudouridine synthase [Clostridiales bacterium]
MTYVVSQEFDGATVYQYLFKKGYSYNAVKKLKQYMGQLTVNGFAVAANVVLRAGDVLAVSEKETDKSRVLPVCMPIEVVYEDEYLLLVNKPPHLATLPTHAHYGASLANGVTAYFIERGVSDFVFRAVNRLDADTSGLLIVAKKNFIQHALLGKIKKTYFLVVNGGIEESGEIALPIKDDSVKKLRYVAPDGLYSLTRYAPIGMGNDDGISFDGSNNIVIATENKVPLEGNDGTVITTEKEMPTKEKNGMTAILAEAVTGRTHQLRVHFAAIGHPIVGDKKYGTPSALIDRQALHSYKAEFVHPVTNALCEIVCPVPDDIKKLF